ncbi:hypothetical protein AB0J63_44065 [Streptosporangium canum]|uniref:hypothetical protein n=1 Tax=Streptosporangium canum TaxID=324952 RepID=UPI003424F1B3
MSGTAHAHALSHIAALPSGGPVDPGLRVTLNLHPDRLVGELAILDRLARTASTSPSSSPGPATAA